MNSLKSIALMLILPLALTACSSTSDDSAALYSPLTPLPGATVDPSDEEMRLAVQKFLNGSEAPANSTYDFTRIDLDADGRRDALVLFKNPYGFWCGMHGCTMLVLKAHDKNFELVNAIQPVREPLYVSRDKTNGWKDLIVRVSGRWSESKDVAMRFDGHEYPQNPGKEAPVSDYVQEARVFYD